MSDYLRSKQQVGAENAPRSYLFTSESVTEGHPDKIADQISDAVLDAILAKEAVLEAQGYIDTDGVPAKLENVRCAVETMLTTGMVVISGEIRTQAYVDIQEIARGVITRIGYDRAKYGFDGTTCGVINMIHGQSPDIAQGVDESYDVQAGATTDPLDLIGAGDQGMMFGYATDETDAYMPMAHYLASRLAERLAEVRHDGTVPYLRPDGKTQVTVRYEDDRPIAVETIVISTQHAPEVEDMAVIKADMLEHVIEPVMQAAGIAWEGAQVYVNPTGRFVVGGPMGDTGLTGRKIIVDTYGGMGRHGGGAFSGKDCTKVDRSAAYAARWVAKNVVAAGLAHRCEVQLAYAIGVAHPLSIMVDTFGTEQVPVASIERAVGEVFDLRPGAIIRDLKLRRPIYQKTAAYGHFGRDDADFTWERLDRVAELRASCGLDAASPASHGFAEVDVRLACAGDLDAVCELYRTACQDMEGKPYDIEWVWGNYPTREGLGANIAAGELLVAELDGKIAGACLVNNAVEPAYDVARWRIDVPQPQVAILHLVVVDPDARGRGIAKALVDASARFAREQGYATVRLDVFDNNDAAVHLYLAHGYEDRGIFTLSYDDGVVHAAHLMELDLRA